MDVHAFISKWKASSLKERSGSQEHFIDLCRLLDEKTPGEADPDGSWYTFEKEAKNQDGRNGFADVWKRGCFAWEYKGKHKDLGKAYEQILRYREKLENPPLLVVSDMEVIEIHTNFTNTAKESHRFTLDDLKESKNLLKLKWLFSDPDRLKPVITVEQVTKDAAGKFSELAKILRERGHDPQAVAHFLSKLLFCMFAEDVGLLPEHIFSKMLNKSGGNPTLFSEMLRELFLAMNKGGRFGLDTIAWFNGGLFDDELVLSLDTEHIRVLREASALDWGQVEPSIFGTLFERGLDPEKRSQLGAHYTPRSDIERVVRPVLMEPLRQDWNNTLVEVEKALAPLEDVEKQFAEIPGNLRNSRNRKFTSLVKKEREIREKAAKLIRAFLDERLRKVTVLDPACGSGNFLYVALELLHDLEKEALVRLAEIDQNEKMDIRVGPQQIFGIELNRYAHELAQVTVWIGHLQWMLDNGFSFERDPVLKKLDNIQCRDAILDLSDPQKPKRSTWPKVDFIVGNPPFLGGNKLKRELGSAYVELLWAVYRDSVPGAADLVCYWFEQARLLFESCPTTRAGFVCTQSIRGGKNRVVLDHLLEKGLIFHAWQDEPWIVEGAAVRISLVCFATQTDGLIMLDGQLVEAIHSDLTASSSIDNGLGVNLTLAQPLKENLNACFQGSQKIGPFEIAGEEARQWLTKSNPNLKPNSEVVKPNWNGLDVSRRPRDIWIVDFGVSMSAEEAALYEIPFQHVLHNVKPERDTNNRDSRRLNWWRHGDPQPAMRRALQGLSRYIATPEVTKHRVFVWMHPSILPDKKLMVVAREDDTTFGILHSKLHEVWSLRMCTWHGDGDEGGRPRYTPTTTFATFPFPQGLLPNVPAVQYADDPRAISIAEAARKLNEYRENWLNPPELIRKEPEVVAGYPDRILPKDEAAARELKKRTLTNLYNQRPQWLINAHRALDESVAMAYGWEPAILNNEDEILSRLFALNQERATSQ